MQYIVFDIESDGLKISDVSKIHCLSYTDCADHIVHTIYEYDDILNFFKQEGCVYLGHKISTYDLPVLTKILGLVVDFPFYDTLFLSAYIFPGRLKWGLESFGLDYGVKKVEIHKDAWKNLSRADAKERCEQDVRINANLWYSIKQRLNILYKDNPEDISRLLKYEEFRVKCAYDQTQNKCRINIPAAYDFIIDLENIREDKYNELRQVMPPIPKYKVHKKPKIMTIKDGSDSSLAVKWFEFLAANGIDKNNEKPVKEVIGHEDPNPGSYDQVKSWLFSLGWEPSTYKLDTKLKKKTGEERFIPQINKEVDGEKVLCDSVLLLAEQEPAIEVLAGLGIVNHRLSVVKGLVEAADDDGYLAQELVTQTSTMRFKQEVVVNLVSVDKPFGDRLRGLFIASNGHKVMGVDVSKLENKVKEHYIYDYDMEYVKTLQDPSYDPYLEIAEMAGFLTAEQVRQHKAKEADYSMQRKWGKVTILSSQYGVGPKTLSRNLGLSYDLAAKLIDTYKLRNKSQYDFAADLKVKTVFGQKWVFNPVSRFWMELRSDKDRLSAIFSSTGVWFFDTFTMYCKHLGIQPVLSVHDELMAFCLDTPEAEAEMAAKLEKAIAYTNSKIKLNVFIGINYKFGENYAQTH